MKLYFIALIPHEELRVSVRALKEEMKARFDVKHALKSPAHITLQTPFKRKEEEESRLIPTLEQFTEQQSEFLLRLNGFGHFSSRVIYVNVEYSQAILELHAQLNHVLAEQLDFQESEIRAELHPHMTIATRDLSKPAFKEAWPEFQHRKFQDSFLVKSLFLLKHNGKHWDIYREFLFHDEK
ncbi:2'-5' RNA ligase family protein [Catalinimonas sp. 4WD22]|uniref:2'-5' RNA ligase family protein n=1 Tax=Catalinimonas locisalis TaxID=3133978 RepID=UPI0031015696